MKNKPILKRMKLCLYGFVVSFLIASGCIYSQVNQRIKELEIRYPIADIKVSLNQSQKVPSRLYEIYEIMNPNVFDYGLLESIIRRSGSCPCNRLRHRLILNSETIWDQILNILAVSSYLERKLTQKECFNYTLLRTDFLYQNKGIEEASCYYFNKELADINDREIIKLIHMLSNSSYYNPKRFPDRANSRANRVLEQIQDKL